MLPIAPRSRPTTWPLAVALLFGLAACSSDPKDEYVERPVEEIYNHGLDQLHDGDYEKSAKEFDEVERQHPYSTWATRAQLMAAYAHYEAQKYDYTINALDRYIELHPCNPNAAYAYYLRALCYYEQIADVTRDQKSTEQAQQALEEVTRRSARSSRGRAGNKHKPR